MRTKVLQIRLLLVLVALYAGIILSSCKPYSCDYMHSGKLVYLKKPYKTTCPYNDKEYKVYAHLYLDIWNNTKVGVVGDIPKDFRTGDTISVLVSFKNEPPLNDIPGFKSGISTKDGDTLPTDFVIIECIAKSN